MIGVIVPPADAPVVREFFELFKTPWEMAQEGKAYSVLLCTEAIVPEIKAPLILHFLHAAVGNEKILSRLSEARLKRDDDEWPLYTPSVTFAGEAGHGVIEATKLEALAVETHAAGTTVIHIGYDLFAEVRHLLLVGQPPAHACIPALELHIELLRRLITEAGLPLVEIPPVPAGYDFLTCLTHDVDHPVLKSHRGDHTMIGFLYRATAGSLLSVLQGRLSAGKMMRNWGAALSLPFVHAGLAKDTWRKSLTDYADLERGLASTFFVIPFKGRPGRGRNGGPPAPKRAATYAPADIASELKHLEQAGAELSVHGLDAWCDSTAGKAEQAAIAMVSQTRDMGVRMHWLYFDEKSHAVLEAAGFSYDSTVGYNQTIGFKAGTAQGYQPLTAMRLIELPLHVMDTSIFYPSYLNLTDKQAEQRVGGLLEATARFGGAFMINWHDRSIAPERQWDGFYRWLIAELKRRGAWFATAGQAAAWFRKRRAVTFESAIWNGDKLQLRTRTTGAHPGPELRLRVHRPAKAGEASKFVDVPFESGELALAI